MNQAATVVDATRGCEVLFFDLAEIEQMNNVVRSVCSAQKHPLNPVLDVADKNAWDSGWVAPWAVRGAAYDESDGLFKVWYGAYEYGGGPGHAGLAVSRDGVVWHRPRVGLFENGGNHDNNIVRDMEWSCITMDRGETDPQRRFKSLNNRQISFSPDGMRWSPWQRISMEFGVKVADSVVFLRDDQESRPERRYKYVFQYYDAPNKPGPEQVRFKGIAFSPDGFTWQAGDNPILCPNDSFEDENHFLAYVPYKGHWLLLYECAWYSPDGTGKYGRYVGDIRLAHSRDGEHFQRVNAHQPVIAKGSVDQWDGQFIVITQEAIIKGDTIYLYYAGMGSEWTSWPRQNEVEGTRTPAGMLGERGPTGTYGLRRMGLATLRLDGFTCMHVPDDVSLGNFITRPIRLGAAEQAALWVNVGSTRPGWSWLEVEALDAQSNEVLPGFGRSECGPIVGDGIRVPVRWRDQSLAALAGKTIRLRFNLNGAARLYSFRLGAQ